MVDDVEMGVPLYETPPTPFQRTPPWSFTASVVGRRAPRAASAWRELGSASSSLSVQFGRSRRMGSLWGGFETIRAAVSLVRKGHTLNELPFAQGWKHPSSPHLPIRA